MMSIFKLPEWLTVHQYSDKHFNEVSEQEWDALKTKLSQFNHPEPEVSIVIPAWNVENALFRTLSSLASNKTSYKVELIVINNNSTDKTQEILDRLEVKNFSEPQQGISFARQLGLIKAKGYYHLCADSDTFYPPDWIDLMIKPMKENKNVVGVYGRYSFLPANTQELSSLFFYEKVTGLLIRIRKRNREFLNVLGFSMGFIREIGINNGGFHVKNVRKFDNAPGDAFVDEAEDGTMALNLLKSGRLKLVTNPKARVFTSTKRLVQDGGIVQAFVKRGKLHGKKLLEYVSGKKVQRS